MLCYQACVEAFCSTTCRSETAGDEERLLCDLEVGHPVYRDFPECTDLLRLS